ncbi:MAG: DNA repair exonuclease [Bacteroidota bacterium]|nr:DNA repair exonuclease [Bacteroidota bacterium]
MAVKILATGDIHLGKRSAGVPEDAREIATKHTWNRMVDYAIDTGIDAILLSGDIVDQDNKFFEANKALEIGCEKLNEQNIPVCMVAGNHDHDVLPEVIKTKDFNNVHLLGNNGKWELKTLNTKNGNIQVAGWSFHATYVPYSPLSKFNLENINPDLPAIGLLHADYGMISSDYAPVQEQDFFNKNIDIWILGHIHKPGLLSDTQGKILYPGSPHALSSKEPGKHGPLLLTIEGKNNITHEWLDFSPVRYEKLSIDTGNPESINDIRPIIRTELKKNAANIQKTSPHLRYLIYDIEITGKFREHNLIGTLQQEITNEAIIENVFVRKLHNKLKPAGAKLKDLAKQSSPAGILADTILKLENNDTSPFIEALMEKWKKKQQEVIHAKIYSPFSYGYQTENTDIDNKAREYLLETCNHTLDALLSQTKNSQS